MNRYGSGYPTDSNNPSEHGFAEYSNIQMSEPVIKKQKIHVEKNVASPSKLPPLKSTWKEKINLSNLTLDKLGKMSYSDINQNKNDDFDPTDVIDMDDNSEDSVLRQFEYPNAR